MKKLPIAIFLALLCLTACSAADNSSVAIDCAVPEAPAEQFSLIQDFDAEVYGLTPETRAAAQGTPACADTEPLNTEPTAACAEPAVASAETPEDFEESSPLIYTIFEPSTYVSTAEDGTKLFLNQNYMPTFSTDVPNAEEWLNEIARIIAEESLEIRIDVEQQAETIFAEQQERAGDITQSFYTYSYYANTSTGRQDEVIISLLQTDNIYCGGAHPNYVQKAYNFDLKTQRLLTLNDILHPEAGHVLLDQILIQLEQKLSTFESIGFFSDYQKIVIDLFAEETLTPYWYFSDHGLVVYFNCYEIAPYAAGIIKVELPYQILDGILLPEYFPAPRYDEDAGMILLESREGRNVITVPSADNDTYLLVGAIGTVYDVRLFRLDSWANEDTPIAGQMLFSANRLTSSDVLELPETGDNSMPIYMLTYRSGAGEQYRFTISREGIRQIGGS